MPRVLGYCALCRAKEIELFGTVLNTAGPRHERACREAGCWHPAFYRFPNLKPSAKTVQAPSAEARA